MRLLELNRHPSDRQLRQFGLISLAALPLVGWIWGASGATMLVLLIAGLLVAAGSLILPKLVQPLFVGLMLIAMPIGLVVGELAMVAIYFGVFLPIGLAFRLVGRDALNLRRNRKASSYWQEKQQPSNVANYYRQS
jgi:hypothetical protein